MIDAICESLMEDTFSHFCAEHEAHRDLSHLYEACAVTK